MKFSTALVTIFSIGLAAATPIQLDDPTPVQLEARATATVGWSDPNTYKNDPAKKADWEQKACDALDRAGCAGGTISGGAHKSPAGGDQKEHVQVVPDGTSGTNKKMHVYGDGTATRKNAKGKVINVRDTDFPYMEGIMIE